MLTKLNIPFVREVSFSGCKSPSTGNYFRFDFYLPTKNILIEYDGEHHLEKYYVWADDLKNKFAKKYGIKIKRFNKEHFEKLESNLYQYLNYF